MGRSKQYTVSGATFQKQKDLDDAVKKALNNHLVDTEFEDQFLADVVNQLHPEVISAGQKVVKFIYLTATEQEKRKLSTVKRWRGGMLLMGYFEPLNDWRDVTVYPWRKPKDNRKEIMIALRELINPKLPKPKSSECCAADGCHARYSTLEYHHVYPNYYAISEKCMELISEHDIETLFGYDKFKPRTFTVADFIPMDHPAVVMLNYLHMDNKWEWLCPYHHRNVRG